MSAEKCNEFDGFSDEIAQLSDQAQRNKQKIETLLSEGKDKWNY